MSALILSTQQYTRHHNKLQRKSWRLLSLLVLGLMLVGGAMGCEVDQNALQRDPFMRDMMQLQQSQNAPSRTFGQTFDVGNTRWNISAAHAALSLRLGSNTPLKAQHGEFIIIDFTFTNLTQRPQHPTADMILLEDAAHVHYKSDPHVTARLSQWQKTANFLTELFQPNRPYDCSIVFDIPLQTTSLSLNFQSFPSQDDSPGI